MKRLLLVLLCFSLIGCAASARNHYNHAVFNFNRKLDKHVVLPVTRFYVRTMPHRLQNMALNFIDNLMGIPTVANDLLQMDYEYASIDTKRFVANSVFGVGGTLDVASHWGIPKHLNDFGLTLAKWGYRHTHYILLPVLGPSTPRDVIGHVVDAGMNPLSYVHPLWIGYAEAAGEFLPRRSRYLGAEKMIDSAFDPYVFVENAYEQKRKKEITIVMHRGHHCHAPTCSGHPLRNSRIS